VVQKSQPPPVDCRPGVRGQIRKGEACPQARAEKNPGKGVFAPTAAPVPSKASQKIDRDPSRRAHLSNLCAFVEYGGPLDRLLYPARRGFRGLSVPTIILRGRLRQKGPRRIPQPRGRTNAAASLQVAVGGRPAEQINHCPKVVKKIHCANLFHPCYQPRCGAEFRHKSGATSVGGQCQTHGLPNRGSSGFRTPPVPDYDCKGRSKVRVPSLVASSIPYQGFQSGVGVGGVGPNRETFPPGRLRWPPVSRAPQFLVVRLDGGAESSSQCQL